MRFVIVLLLMSLAEMATSHRNSVLTLAQTRVVSCSISDASSNSGAVAALCKLRGGEAVRIGKKRKQKLSFPFMVKAFFTSMVDPTYSGVIEAPAPAPAVKGKKGSKGKGKAASAGPFGAAGVTGGTGFGPVCGPNGCT